LWAAKETAYKAISKSNPGISSAPKKYPVFIRSIEEGPGFKGEVKTPAQRVKIVVYHHGDAIHCIGKTGPSEGTNRIIHGIEKTDDTVEPNYCQSSNDVSNHVRRIAIDRIAKHATCDKDDIIITKTPHTDGCAYSYPVVIIRNQKYPMDISLSHDGRFVAYAFCVAT